MEQLTIVIPTLLGLEAVTARELKDLGYAPACEDGKVTFRGGWADVARANLWLRTGERVLVQVGCFTATTFGRLFEGCKALEWSRFLPANAAFPVKGHCLKSTLHSVPDCQSIIKKSIVQSLKGKYKQSWFPEDGALHQVQFQILKDKVTLLLDTTGIPLHKRGYRADSNRAPLRETMAAAMILLSYWRKDRLLCDPFCGSGTIPIEAAMIAKQMAPGLKRTFAGEKFSQMPASMWQTERESAAAKAIEDIDLEIRGSDIDPHAVELTASNCEKAGVDDVIKVRRSDVKDFAPGRDYGIIICNPPYGERLGDHDQAKALYQTLGKVYRRLENWSLYALTSFEGFEAAFGAPASKRRKMYNGMLKCNYYQYFGPKPNRQI